MCCCFGGGGVVVVAAVVLLLFLLVFFKYPKDWLHLENFVNRELIYEHVDVWPYTCSQGGMG